MNVLAAQKDGMNAALINFQEKKYEAAFKFLCQSNEERNIISINLEEPLTEPVIYDSPSDESIPEFDEDTNSYI